MFDWEVYSKERLASRWDIDQTSKEDILIWICPVRCLCSNTRALIVWLSVAYLSGDMREK